MMYEGKHIHFSPADNKPLCSYSSKLCKQRRLNGYAFCIRHILEDKSAPFKRCSHVARYNNQYCTNPIPSSEDRDYCNSHLQALGMAPKKEKKSKKDKKNVTVSPSTENKVKFEDRLRALIQTGYDSSNLLDEKSIPNSISDDPYAFNDTPALLNPSFGSAKALLNSVGSKTNNDSNSVNEFFVNDSRSDSNSPVNNKKLLSSPLESNKGCVRNQQGKRSSKTMNMLQEKIAQNRLLDKLKKTQDSSQIISSNCFNNTESDGANDTFSINHHNKVKISNSVAGINDKSVPVCLNSASASLGKNNQSTNQPYYSVFHPHMMLEGMHPRLPPPPYSQALQYQSRQNSVVARSTIKNPPSSKTDKILTKYECGKIKVKSKRNPDKVSHKSSTSHLVPVSSHSAQVSSSISHIKMIYNHKKLQKKNLLPLGLEFSDSDNSDSDEEDRCSCQNQWFQVFDNTSVTCNPSEDHLARRKVRPARLSLLKSEMRRQLCQLSKSQALSNEHSNSNVTSRHNLLLKLIQSAKLSAKSTVDLVMQRKKSSSYQQNNSPKPKKCKKPNGVAKKLCCYSNDGKSCPGLAIPFSRHCTKHITYNVDQLLFEHCTAKFADNTQCCIPVFDICHELPLCPEHARKRDNYNKNASDPKNKKSKRKQKPSVLNRTPKSNKKKKRPSSSRNKLASAQLPFDENEAMATSYDTNSDGGESNAINNIVDADSKSISNDFCGSNEMQTEDLPNDMDNQLDPELDNNIVDDDLSPEVMDNALELPLDTAELANQASRLLEEHDFTEVLNKIPDDAFNDLFAESRNGEFMPSKEETEELERALAAVSKDVNSVKESLEKLSTAQIEEALGLNDGSLLSSTDQLAIDVQTLTNLTSTPSGELEMLNGQFNQSDFTQALSSMNNDSIHNTSSQSHISMPNGLASNSLLTSDLQHLQTQYLQQPSVSTSISHFSDNHISSSNHLSSFPVNGVNISESSGRESNQWILQQQHSQQMFPQNGYLFNNQQNNVLDSISNVKFPVNQIDQQLPSTPVMKQALSADSFHVVNNSTLETVSQQSTPAS